MWNLEDAISMVRKIAPIAKKHGFTVALYGGVLEKGVGNDLDLFLVEQEPDICDVAGCLDEIASLPEIHHHGGLHDLNNEMTAVIWLRNREHIDAHFSRFCQALQLNPCAHLVHKQAARCTKMRQIGTNGHGANC